MKFNKDYRKLAKYYKSIKCHINKETYRKSQESALIFGFCILISVILSIILILIKG